MFRTLPESVPRYRLLSPLTARRRTRKIRTLSRTHLGTRWIPPATRAPVSPRHPLHQDLEPMIPAARKMIVLYLRYLTQFPSLMCFRNAGFSRSGSSGGGEHDATLCQIWGSSTLSHSEDPGRRLWYRRCSAHQAPEGTWHRSLA